MKNPLSPLDCKCRAGTSITFTVSSFVLAFACLVWVAYAVHRDWQREAIQHKAGYYDPHTGHFRWNDSKTPDEEKP